MSEHWGSTFRYSGPQLDLQGIACYLNPHRLPPAQLILWSTCLGTLLDLLERVPFPCTCQEVLPEAESILFLISQDRDTITASQDRDPSYLATLPLSTAPSAAISQLWGCCRCFSSHSIHLQQDAEPKIFFITKHHQHEF